MIEQKKNFYIDGQWVKPSKSNDFEVIDPSTEEICAIISLGSESDTNLAVNAAKKSFLTWWDTSKEKKLELLNNLLSIYQKRSSDMAKAISLERGRIFSELSELSALKTCIPPTLSNGKIVIAITIIPIPPSHCNRALQIKIPFEDRSTSIKIVDPVVVIPDIVSKYASVKFKLRVENIKGSDPNKDINNQAKVVIKKACCIFNFLFFV